MRKSFNKALSLFMAAVMTVGLGSGIAAPQTTEAATLPAKKAEPLMTAPYHAYLCFQSDLYSYRDAFDDDASGMTVTSIPRTTTTKIYESMEKMALDAPNKTTNAGVSVFDWRKMFIANVPIPNATETKDVEFRDLNADGTKDKYTVPDPLKTVVKIADFQQPDITYDGTYTVSMSNFDETTFQYDHGFRMLYVDTTIPLTKKGVTFSNITLKIDGNVISTTQNGIIRNASDAPNSYKLMVANEYGYEDYGLKAQAPNTSKNDAVPDPVWEAAKTNGGVFTMPKKSIEITFTISGMGAAPAGYVPQDDHAIAASTQSIIQQQQQQAASRAAISSLAKGKTFAAGNFTYKVTKAAATNGLAKVAVTGVAKKAQKKTSLSVPNTATYKDYDYNVTSINAKAFAKCKKLKKVALGSKVTTLEKNSFAKCKKLTGLTVKGKLKTVKKKAFAGCKKTIKVSGTAKYKKANIKALKKSGYKKFK